MAYIYPSFGKSGPDYSTLDWAIKSGGMVGAMPGSAKANALRAQRGGLSYGAGTGAGMSQLPQMPHYDPQSPPMMVNPGAGGYVMPRSIDGGMQQRQGYGRRPWPPRPLGFQYFQGGYQRPQRGLIPPRYAAPLAGY